METAVDTRQAIKIIGEELTFNPSPEADLFMEQLAILINEIIRNDFSRLVNLLYKLDIDEKKLKVLLSHHPADLSGNIIAKLIFERQLEKIKTRRKFNRDSNIEESEKW